MGYGGSTGRQTEVLLYCWRTRTTGRKLCSFVVAVVHGCLLPPPPLLLPFLLPPHLLLPPLLLLSQLEQLACLFWRLGVV